LSNVLREQVRIFEAGKWKPTQEMDEQLDIFVSEKDAFYPVDKSTSPSTTKVSNNNNNGVYLRNDHSNYKGNSIGNAVGESANLANSNTASSKFSAPASVANNGSWRTANTQQGGWGGGKFPNS